MRPCCGRGAPFVATLLPPLPPSTSNSMAIPTTTTVFLLPSTLFICVVGRLISLSHSQKDEVRQRTPLPSSVTLFPALLPLLLLLLALVLPQVPYNQFFGLYLLKDRPCRESGRRERERVPFQTPLYPWSLPVALLVPDCPCNCIFTKTRERCSSKSGGLQAAVYVPGRISPNRIGAVLPSAVAGSFA